MKMYLSKRLLVVSKEMGELQEMSEEFEKIQSEKTNTKYYLPDRERLFATYFKTHSERIIAVVESAIKHAKEQLDKIQQAKEEKI